MSRTSVFNEEIFFNLRVSNYKGALPEFYKESDFPELTEIKEQWQTILAEVRSYEKEKGAITGLTTYTPPELSGNSPWSNIYLENFMWQFHKYRKYFPATCSMLSKIPGCTLAAISILSPHSAIEPHFGDTNAIIRCHLGLEVPASYPECGIRVGQSEEGWSDGALTIFSEAHYHNAWNNTERKRYLLVFDIIHPALRRKRFWICSKVLGAQTYIFLEKKIPSLKVLPNIVLFPIHIFFSILWAIYLPFNRGAKFLYRQ